MNCKYDNNFRKDNIQFYVLENECLRLEVMNLGATVTSIQYHGKEMTLRYKDPAEYLRHSDYIGAIVGRYANRISKGKADIAGKSYQLTPNEGSNQLHGGPEGFHQKLWTADEMSNEHLRLTVFSPAEECGYPGNLTAGVTYSLIENILRVEIDGVSDQDTLFAPTTHMYFNFGSTSVLDANLQINASSYIAVDKENIPVGIVPLSKEFDFRTLRRIGRNYDHCFPFTGEPQCVLEDNGIRMSIKTDYPAIQVYTGEFLNAPMRQNQGIALEPEFFPDSPNHPEYPSAVLIKNQRFHRYIEYRFETVISGLCST